jgi:hypothetical protein
MNSRYCRIHQKEEVNKIQGPFNSYNESLPEPFFTILPLEREMILCDNELTQESQVAAAR